jgi:hypothetical protein
MFRFLLVSVMGHDLARAPDFFHDLFRLVVVGTRAALREVPNHIHKLGFGTVREVGWWWTVSSLCGAYIKWDGQIVSPRVAVCRQRHPVANRRVGSALVVFQGNRDQVVGIYSV